MREVRYETLRTNEDFFSFFTKHWRSFAGIFQVEDMPSIENANVSSEEKATMVLCRILEKSEPVSKDAFIQKIKSLLPSEKVFYPWTNLHAQGTSSKAIIRFCRILERHFFAIFGNYSQYRVSRSLDWLCVESCILFVEERSKFKSF